MHANIQPHEHQGGPALMQGDETPDTNVHRGKNISSQPVTY